MRNLKLGFVLISLLYVAEASASVIYNNAGDLSSFSPSSGWHVHDYQPTWQDAFQFAAMPFTLTQESSVTGAELALTALATWSRDYLVQILGDADGLPNSVPLWTASSLEDIPIQQPQHPPYSFTTVTGDAVLLEANTRYWLSLTCIAKCEMYWWWPTHSNSPPGAVQHNTGYPGYVHWTLLDITGVNSAMFRITGDAASISEPVPVFLLAFGLVIFVVSRRIKPVQIDPKTICKTM